MGSPYLALMDRAHMSTQLSTQYRCRCCRNTVDCQAACTGKWVQGNFGSVCLCADGVCYTGGLGVLGRYPRRMTGTKASHARVVNSLMTLEVSHSVDLQAFGNNISQLVVLSIQPVTDWAVAAAEIML